MGILDEEYQKFRDKKKNKQQVPSAVLDNSPRSDALKFMDEQLVKIREERKIADAKRKDAWIAQNRPITIETQFGEPTANIPISDAPAPENVRWGPAMDILDAFTAGTGGTIANATAGTIGKTIDQMGEKGLSALEDIPSNYVDQFLRAREARKRYEKEQPINNMITDLIGSAIPVGAAVNLGARGAQLAARYLFGQNAERFVAGNAGRAVAPLPGGSMNLPGRGNELLRAASRGTSGAIAGGAGTAATVNMYDVPWQDQIGLGTGVGAVLNASPFGKMVKDFGDMIYPTVNPTVARNAARAIDADIPISAFQMAPGQFPQLVEESIGHHAANVRLDKANEHIFRSVGLPRTNNIDPTVWNAQRGVLGRDIESIGQQINVIPDAQLYRDMRGVLNNISSDPEVRHQYRDVIDTIGNMIDSIHNYGGNIPGNEFVKMTGTGSDFDRLYKHSSPYVQRYATQLKNAMYEAMDRSAQGNPHVPNNFSDDLKEARRRLANWFTVENSGAYDPQSGKVDPRSLGNYINNDNYFQKSGDLDIIRQTRNWLPNVNSSGGAETHQGMTAKIIDNALNLGSTAGLGAASSLLFHTENWPLITAIAVAGYGAKRGLVNAIENPGLTRAFVNKSLGTNIPTNASTNMLMDSLNNIRHTTPSNIAKFNPLVPHYSIWDQEARDE